MHAGKARLQVCSSRTRFNHGDTGMDGNVAGFNVERVMTYAHTRHVGNGVEHAGGARTDGDAKLTDTHGAVLVVRLSTASVETWPALDDNPHALPPRGYLSDLILVHTRVRTRSIFCGSGCTTYKDLSASLVGVRLGLAVMSWLISASESLLALG